MKVKVFRHDDEKIFYKVNNVRDLCDIGRFPHNDFHDWKTLFEVKTEREGIKIAMRLFYDFMILLAYDMIFHRVVFIFPFKSWGYMKMTDTTDKQREDYDYCFDTNGRYYKPVLFLNKISRYNPKYYVVRFTREWRRLIFAMIKNGNSW